MKRKLNLEEVAVDTQIGEESLDETNMEELVKSLNPLNH